MLKVERTTVLQQVSFGSLVGLIVVVASWAFFYVGILHPLEVPVIEGSYLHGVVLAPSDLLSRRDVVQFDVDIEPCCAQPELKLFSPESVERWTVLLVYRSEGRATKSVTWRFITGYDMRTGARVPLHGVADVSLVSAYGSAMLATPLAFKNLIVPHPSPVRRLLGASV